MGGKYKTSRLCLGGFVQALGLGGYCGLVGLVFLNGDSWFGKMDRYWGPMLFLMLFVVSAMISTLIVFYYPYKLFILDKKREAVQLVMCTTGWLIGLVVVGLVMMIVF